MTCASVEVDSARKRDNLLIRSKICILESMFGTDLFGVQHTDVFTETKESPPPQSG